MRLQNDATAIWHDALWCVVLGVAEPFRGIQRHSEEGFLGSVSMSDGT